MKSIFSFSLFFSLLILAGCDSQTDAPTGPDANFSVIGYDKPAPATASFINTSVDATTYLWNFGDGVTSTDFNPSHLYNFPGTFPVTLKVTNGSKSDSICKLVDIEIAVPANQSSFSYFFDKCSGYPVGAAFKTLNPASTAVVWSINGAQNVNRDPILLFPVPGDYTIKHSSLLGGVRDTVTRVIRIQ